MTSRFDLRAGAARLVWGRLDEFQPTDVVNPIDLSRFLMEGRSEARLPVGLVRGRAVFLPHSTTLEAVVVPVLSARAFRPAGRGVVAIQSDAERMAPLKGVPCRAFPREG